MFPSKSFITIASIVSIGKIDAFITPKPISLASNRVSDFDTSTTSISSNQFRQVGRDFTKNKTHFDHALKFWKQKDNVDTSVSLTPIDAYVDSTLATDKDDVPLSTLVLVGSSLFSFTYVVQRLQIYLNVPCLNAEQANICTTEYHEFANFFAQHDFLSFMMILTHSIPFVLLPWVSKQISDVGPTIKKDFEEFNPFISEFHQN